MNAKYALKQLQIRLRLTAMKNKYKKTYKELPYPYKFSIQ